MSMRRTDRVSKGSRSLSQPHPPRSSSIFDPDQTMMDISEVIFSNDSRDVQYAPAGSICEILNLYQTNPGRNGIGSWTREHTTGIWGQAKVPESGQYALLVRNIKCSNEHREFEIDSIVVQSDHIKSFLARVMDGYPGITMSRKRVQFSKPFEPFVHRWEMLSEARDNESNAQAKAHVDLLYGVLAAELSDVITNKQNLVLAGVITFDMLWTIFEPGQIALSTVDNCNRAFRLEKGWSGSGFEIDTVYIDYNGHGFGYRKHSLSIPTFEDTKPIMSLPVIPFVFHNDKDTLRKSLTLRGKLWYQHKGHHHKHYEGLALTSYGDQEIRYKINSRVIIDTEAYLEFHSDESPISLEAISDSPADKDFLIATPILRGYSLKDRKWLEFFIDGVTDIVWNSRPFKSLILPGGEAKDLKDLVLAFASSQSKNSDISDNLLKGRGRNVIVLLHGPPGVGKTLTAECVAEVMQVPLYVQNAGALGTTAASIEKSLSVVLRIVPKWGAVLLLGEADIFTQEHNPSDPKERELYHAFLPLLEYFEGVLFLASNRVEVIGPTLESRIDVAIHYPRLDSESRRHIWTRLLGKSDRKAFSEGEIFNLGDCDLNGREIRDVLNTARVLARYRDTKLSYKHVLTALQLSTRPVSRMIIES
ncbi:P-loop containing nucleoside triphosphate hydrolase protein [Aspergillus eucalypticola CBS 122712]|uniref:P-loop containing nucleoside triphosphate hydrolase protein n=1 Tax=Aspergillus eucalypticola (strain CBS 122712 / IBT 29274) TaxID=1448314 RepID=A0A317W102_ASPEC|nr:P-loop containing nucleoside triphosphate hydrolase protein [Aspergillus eucalypticola CBS 122712]PWY77830.1 P-loop containing nucleoside triphosphate hydrolase protein [Aspergillus eucalypticola CBS 122712]